MPQLTLRTAVLTALAVFVIWALGGYLVYLTQPAAERASFGDMFGAVNALFSGFAFAGLIFAILLQREELSLQRGELELTRRELAASSEAHCASAKSLADQTRLQLHLAQLNALTAQVQSLTAEIDQQYQRYQVHATKSTTAQLPETASLSAKRAGVTAQIGEVLVQIEAELAPTALPIGEAGGGDPRRLPLG